MAEINHQVGSRKKGHIIMGIPPTKNSNLTLFIIWMVVFLFLKAGSVTAGPSSGALPAFDHPLKCLGKTKRILKKWGSKNRWKREIDFYPGGRTYRSPTQKFGAWVEISVTRKGVPEISLMKQEGTLKIRMDSNKGCRPQVSTWARKLGKGRVFNDDHLNSLLKNKKEGLIYVWSPGMVYSMTMFKTLKEIAKKMKIPTHVLLDPVSPLESSRKRALKIDQELSTRRIASVELFARDMTMHFPMTLYFGNGKLATHAFTGAGTKEQFRTYIQFQRKRVGGP